jgi:hypothetical protein
LGKLTQGSWTGTILRLGCSYCNPALPREIDLRSVLPRGLQIWSLKMAVQRLLIVFTMLASCASVGPTSAQTPNPELEACRSTGLMALRERNPAIKDISFDVDGMTVAKANTKVEDTPIKTIVIGDAYLEKGKQDTRRTFLCLIGEKGKVLLTFFTDK